jgi:hypothetical protein
MARGSNPSFDSAGTISAGYGSMRLRESVLSLGEGVEQRPPGLVAPPSGATRVKTQKNWNHNTLLSLG